MTHIPQPINNDADPRPLGNLADVKRALNIGRTAIYRRLQDDADFPRPFKPGRQLTWYMDEIYAYRASRPRRQYVVGEPAE